MLKAPMLSKPNCLKVCFPGHGFKRSTFELRSLQRGVSVWCPAETLLLL